jgi:alpha-L-fucosidase
VLVAFRAERDRIFANDLAQGAQASGSHLRGRKYHASNVLDTTYHTYWAATDTSATLTLTLDGEQTFDIVMLQEYIPLGQRVCQFTLLADGQPVAEGTTIGYKRLLRLPHPVTARTLTLTFHGFAAPVLNRVALYNSQAQ